MTSGDLRWAVDGRGQVTSDPVEAMREGAGLPLGGEEETGGYKGYGLALMVEVLCGVMSGVTAQHSAHHDITLLLSGGTWGPHIRQWGRSDAPGGLSHCFIALNPAVCGAGPEFSQRLQSLLTTFRDLQPAEPDSPVLVPGDPERLREAEVSKSGGVSYSGSQHRRFRLMSEKFGVKPPPVNELK